MPDGAKQPPGAGTGSCSRYPAWSAPSTRCAGTPVRFRNDIVTGVGVKQILIDDPSGNPVELFEPIHPEARLGGQ
jgi:hypothetical protein